MELNELHVDQLHARVISQRVPVAGVLPTVAGDSVRAANSARREDDRFRLEQSESAALSIIGESADDAVSVLEQGQHRAFHVHIDSLMDAVVLQGSNHLEPGAVSDVSQSRILVPAEVPLKYA